MSEEKERKQKQELKFLILVSEETVPAVIDTENTIVTEL